MSPERWGVVGGGILGMSLAMWLRDRGHQVTLFEAAEELGGLASAWQIGDVTWDRHYHVTLNSDRHLLSLLDRLGLTDELRWVETRTGVYSGGRLYSVSNTLEYLRFPPLRMVDKLRMGWTIIYGSRLHNWRRLEQIPVEDWLRRHSGDRAFEEFWLPLLRSKLGDNYRRTSAAFIWTTIQRLYAARRSGLKKEMFGYVAGGYSRILARFAVELEALGVEIVLGARVSSVGPSPAGVEICIGGEAISLDRVVVTAASPIAARLIAGIEPSEQATMSAVQYQGIVCASMLTDVGLGGFYVTNITDDHLPFTGVIEMSALVDRAEFGGLALTYLPRYTTANDRINTQSDDEVRASFTSAIADMFPGFDMASVKAFKVSRVPYVFPIPTIGYSERIPPMQTSVKGVYAVSSAQILNGTLNVNETVQLAARALPVLTGEMTYDRSLLEADVEPILLGAPA
ncbi:MAG: NAD(P)/FAD-dependent oxidoreductase [Acidimicrobiia bacterium]